MKDQRLGLGSVATDRSAASAVGGWVPLAAAALVAGLIGCGQKGPLIAAKPLPPSRGASASAAAPTTGPVTAATAASSPPSLPAPSIPAPTSPTNSQ